jgi:type II secretory pathway component PulM
MRVPDETPEHLTTTEARAGTGPRDMRLVLGAGLVLVVVIFAVILLLAG